MAELIFSQYQIRIKKINKIKTFSTDPIFFKEVTGNTYYFFRPNDTNKETCIYLIPEL